MKHIYIDWVFTRSYVNLNKYLYTFFRTIMEYRDPSLPTVIISLEITETFVYNLMTPQQWEMMESLDPEQNIGMYKNA